MTDHNLFYYPYASFTNAQLPLLKVAALYFDKLFILDPVGASWDSIGADHIARDAVMQLKDAGILQIVTPGDVLAEYAKPIEDAIRRDMGDREFVELCEAQSRATGKQQWTLSLAKVPQDLQTDQAMRRLMGDFARESLRVSVNHGRDSEDYVEYDETEVGAIIDQHARLARLRNSGPELQVYDEYREGYDGDVVYRYAEFPLALGESIMMNHALFAGLLQSNAAPITGDPFHSRALVHKLQRAAQEPTIRRAISDRAAQRQLKMSAFAVSALADSQIRLPILNTQLPMTEVLKYRQRNGDALVKARETLGLMARRIQAEPWSEEFEREIEHKTLPDLIEQLNKVRVVRDKWLDGHGTKHLLEASGIAIGAASAVLAVMTAPITPVALATAGLSLAAGSVVPAAKWLVDWRDGKRSIQENGLHYLLTI